MPRSERGISFSESLSMAAQSSAMNRAGGCLESLHGGCILGLFNCFMLAMIAFVGYFFWSSYTLNTQGEFVTGRVIAMDENRDNEGQLSYSPIVEYRVAGEAYTLNSGIATNPPSYKVGDEVTLRYMADNPQHAELDTVWNSPFIYGGVVTIMLLSMVVLNIIGLRRIWRGESIDE